jgi:hypothetical protein
LAFVAGGEVEVLDMDLQGLADVQARLVDEPEQQPVALLGSRRGSALVAQGTPRCSGSGRRTRSSWAMGLAGVVSWR